MFFGDWLQRREMLSPNKVALIDAINDNRPITYQEWNQQTNQLANLNMILIKPSAYRDMLQRLGLAEEQSVYNADYGHIGEQDSIINIVEGLKQGRLKDGDVMIIVGAGVGYVWGAACVRWGLCET